MPAMDKGRDSGFAPKTVLRAGRDAGKMTGVIANKEAYQSTIRYTDNIGYGREMESLLFGYEVGRGVSRVVYECKLDVSAVVKYEFGDCYQNVIEYETWNRVHGTPACKWFAPVLSMSALGTLLVMAKVAPLGLKDTPSALPGFFSDVKRSNFGIYKGRVVCCDYGTMLERSFDKRALRKVKW